VQFDIVDFYPSISSELLTNSIQFAAQHVDISAETTDVVMHARKSLLFNNNSTWIKKNGSLFDVTMGSYDGAEVCELVGIYILSRLKTKFDNLQLGLYRDDGLGVIKAMSGSRLERIKKDIIKFFQDNGLRITIDTNLTQVNFLDVTLDLSNSKYWPFRKDNDQPLYIHKDSNHPPNITKQLPHMIEKRISDLSCNSDEFDKVKATYNTGLSNSGFSHNIQYNKSTSSKKTRTRKRNILWFNPPYNSAVKINIGRKFLSIITKHFPTHHKYSKIFNKNTVKISYSCSPSLRSIISKHNKKILKKDPNEQPGPANSDNNSKCNCRQSNPCPLNGQCLEVAFVNKATVTTENSTKSYTRSKRDILATRPLSTTITCLL